MALDANDRQEIVNLVREEVQKLAQDLQSGKGLDVRAVGTPLGGASRLAAQPAARANDQCCNGCD